MRKKLTKTGNSLALVLDKRLLDQLGINAKTSLEVSTNGDVLVMSCGMGPGCWTSTIKSATTAS
jgi:antitoxin component of MazEF toxin-antitoxin module